MTLVATLTPNEVPFLIGDLLVTAGPEARGVPPGSVYLPTLGASSRAVNEQGDWYIATTMQKCVLVSDQLAIGWSGDYYPARRILIAARDHFRGRSSVTPADVRDFFATQDYDDQAAVKLVGWCISGDRAANFSLNADAQIASPVWGRSLIAGSGANLFRSFIEANYSLGLDSTSGVREALGKVWFLWLTFLIGELESGFSLVNRFGGFFEVCVASEGKMRKLDDISMFFWRAEIAHESEFVLDRKMTCFSIRYVDDVLAIVRWQTDRLWQSEIPVEIPPSIYLVDTIYGCLDRVFNFQTGSVRPGYDLTDLGTNSKTQAHFFFVYRNGKFLTIAFVIDTMEDGRMIEFVAKGSERIMGMTGKFVQNTHKLLTLVAEQEVTRG